MIKRLRSFPLPTRQEILAGLDRAGDVLAWITMILAGLALIAYATFETFNV